MTDLTHEGSAAGAGRQLAPAAPWPLVNHDSGTWPDLRVRGAPVEEGRAIDLRQFFHVLWSHKIVVAVMLFLSLLAGVAITLTTTPLYTASTTLQIERNATRVINVGEVQPQEGANSGADFLETQYGLLRTRALAARVVDSLGLAQSADFYRAMRAKHPERFAQLSTTARRERVIDLVQGAQKVEPMGGSRLVRVSLSTPSPSLSVLLANAFAEDFIALNLDRRLESTAYARDFLEKHLGQMKAKLEGSERELVRYAVDQQIISLDGDAADPKQSRSLVTADLAALDASLSAAKADRIRAEQRWREAQSRPAMNLSEVLQSPLIQQLGQRRAQLSAEYQDKLRIYKPEFPAMLQEKAQLDELDQQIATEGRNIRMSVKSQYDATQNAENALSAQVSKLKTSALDLRGRSIRYNTLQREVDTNRTLYDGLLQRYKEIGVAGNVSPNNVAVVDRAQTPHGPSKPKPALNIAFAGLVGIALGGLAAFGLETLDQALRNPAEMETKFGVPLLGAVPMLPRGMTAGDALSDPRSSFLEAHHAVRAALQFAAKKGGARSFLFTSTRQYEGKSTTAFAVASQFARLGRRTLLVDADLRNPSLHLLLGADPDGPGLSELLSGGAELEYVKQDVGVPNLTFVSSGKLPDHPAELLAGGRLSEIIAQAERDYEVVILDGPPVMGLADAPLLASTVGGAVFVIEAGGVDRQQVEAALRNLQRAQANLLGAIMTKFDPRRAPSTAFGGGFDYAYGYGASARRLTGT